MRSPQYARLTCSLAVIVTSLSFWATASGTASSDPIAVGARRVAGDDLLLVPGLGGSLPLYLFTEGLATPAVTVPIANHDNNQHATSENLRIANLWYAMDLYAALLTMQ